MSSKYRSIPVMVRSDLVARYAELRRRQGGLRAELQIELGTELDQVLEKRIPEMEAELAAKAKAAIPPAAA